MLPSIIVLDTSNMIIQGSAARRDRRRPRLRAAARRGFAAIAGLTVLSLAGCQKVQFYEKQYLANALMQFDEDPTLDNFRQKVIYSREATTGGIGAKAGGGCGCTN